MGLEKTGCLGFVWLTSCLLFCVASVSYLPFFAFEFFSCIYIHNSPSCVQSADCIMQLDSPPFQVWSPGSPFDPGNSYADGDLDQAEPLALQAVNRTTDEFYGEDGGEGGEDSKVAVSLLLTGIISFRCARQIKLSGQCPSPYTYFIGPKSDQRLVLSVTYSTKL